MHSLLHLNHNAFLFQQLKARAAERAMAEEKREAANLRHKYGVLTPVFQGFYGVLMLGGI